MWCGRERWEECRGVVWEGEVGGVQRCCVGGRGGRSAEVWCGRERWEDCRGVAWEKEVGVGGRGRSAKVLCGRKR